MRYFNFATGLTMTNSHFDELFGGPPRHPEGAITRRDMDLATSIQKGRKKCPAVRPTSFHWAWLRLGWILGWINRRIILTLLFFVVILPRGLLMRALGPDPVSPKLDPDAPSYRVRSRNRTRESMARPF